MNDKPRRRKTDTIWGWIIERLPAYIAIVATLILLFFAITNRARINDLRTAETLACERSNRSDRVLQRLMEESYEVNVRPGVYKLNQKEIGSKDAARLLRIYPRDIMILRRKLCPPGADTLEEREKIRKETVERIRKIEIKNGPPYPGYKLTPLNFNAEAE